MEFKNRMLEMIKDFLEKEKKLVLDSFTDIEDKKNYLSLIDYYLGEINSSEDMFNFSINNLIEKGYLIRELTDIRHMLNPIALITDDNLDDEDLATAKVFSVFILEKASETKSIIHHTVVALTKEELYREFSPHLSEVDTIDILAAKIFDRVLNNTSKNIVGHIDTIESIVSLYTTNERIYGFENFSPETDNLNIIPSLINFNTFGYGIDFSYNSLIRLYDEEEENIFSLIKYEQEKMEYANIKTTSTDISILNRRFLIYTIKEYLKEIDENLFEYSEFAKDAYYSKIDEATDVYASKSEKEEQLLHYTINNFIGEKKSTSLKESLSFIGNLKDGKEFKDFIIETIENLFFTKQYFLIIDNLTKNTGNELKSFETLENFVIANKNIVYKITYINRFLTLDYIRDKTRYDFTLHLTNLAFFKIRYNAQEVDLGIILVLTELKRKYPDLKSVTVIDKKGNEVKNVSLDYIHNLDDIKALKYINMTIEI